MTTLLPAPLTPADPVAGPRRRPVVVAHRGNSSLAPQNTVAALDAAWRAGAGAIEIDVQLSADGVVVVIHDDTVDSTTDGSGAVADLTLAELRALDAGSWFSSHHAGERIPTLSEVLAFVAAHPGTDLLLELKDAWTVPEAALVTTAVDEAGLADRVVVQSFWPDTVAALRDAAPHLPRGLLVSEEHPEAVALAGDLGVVCCNPSVAMATDPDADLVARLHAQGLRVMVWTADEPEEWAALLGTDGGTGVDAIITDRPDRLAGWLAGRLGG
ncbi:glycerophosphodiester phosphodiesterase [Antribacter gilvus]|uniref:glycerophosphodiester phosphodiesterase n=1 Tax=Antribacter gilvus TaxID=2304675 RepID=UPI001F0C91B9|nr:glycerophosphodiester phosphodiesterase family protein [Antribacter gilvus]